MAIYQFDTTVNGISEMKRILNLAGGVITNILFESTTSIIFSTPRSNKLIRITNTLNLFVGDSYTSGSTMVNEVLICTPFDNIYSSTFNAWMIITPDIVCYSVSHPSSTSNTAFWMLGKLNNNDFCVLSGDSGSTQSTNNFSRWYNTTQAIQLVPAFIPSGIMTDNANFYTTYDMPFKIAGIDQYFSGKLNGLKWLQKAFSQNESIQIFGNDIVVGCKQMHNTGIVGISTSLLILNGNV